MAKFISTKNFYDFPCTHRQWSASSHCKFIHGYSRSFHFQFEAKSLTQQKWVMDFGNLKDIKEWLQSVFDHTFLVSEDDPFKESFQKLEEQGIIQMRVLPSTSMEGTAKFVYEKTNKIISEKTKSRVKIISVEVRENKNNSAIYISKEED